MRRKYVLKKNNNDKNRFLFNSIVVSNLKRGNDGASSSAGDRSESFSDLQLATLDTVFVSSKGNSQQAVIVRTTKALKLDEKQVG